MEPSPPKLGPILLERRKELGLTLTQLAELSGVSKSMLSQIERGHVNPTFATIWNLTRALNISIERLLGRDTNDADPTPAIDYVPANHVPVITNRDGSCILQILSPVSSAGQLEWYYITIAPGGSLDSDAHETGCQEHVHLHAGTVEIKSDASTQKMMPGDTTRYRADTPHAISNIGDSPAEVTLMVLINST
ncbi:MAG: XRE family transcriptional regulator [Sphingomonadales bacterium]